MEQPQQVNDVVVVMVPFPVQGHLNQFLHMSRIIATRGIPVHYIGSATHNCQGKDRVQGWEPATISNIHFHDVQLPEFITPPPNPHDTNKFPSHLIPAFEASVHLLEPLGELLRALSSSCRRVVVVHDLLTSMASEQVSLVSNAEAYGFVVFSSFAVLHMVWEAIGSPADEEETILPKDVPRVSFGKLDIPDAFSDFTSRNLQCWDLRAGEIYNTCDAIEGRFINLLARRQEGKKIFAFGPFHPLSFDSTEGPRHRCLEWLDKQPPSSVLYVSFGTVASFSDDQIAELAIGLERSGQRFIWILRDADRGDIYNKAEARKSDLPKGFEDRIQGIGMIVRDWAPQLQILAHSSTGGFLSHCGWNSCIESFSMGVPIAAWPIWSDQPRNALLITEVLKVGLYVREWARRDELISSQTIASSIKKLMVSDEGNMVREKAKELGIHVRGAVSDDGTSVIQLELFFTHITR
nr:glycosyltransferase [Helleborus thibetanus]